MKTSVASMNNIPMMAWSGLKNASQKKSTQDTRAKPMPGARNILQRYPTLVSPFKWCGRISCRIRIPMRMGIIKVSNIWMFMGNYCSSGLWSKTNSPHFLTGVNPYLPSISLSCSSFRLLLMNLLKRLDDINGYHSGAAKMVLGSKHDIWSI